MAHRCVANVATIFVAASAFSRAFVGPARRAVVVAAVARAAVHESFPFVGPAPWTSRCLDVVVAPGVDGAPRIMGVCEMRFHRGGDRWQGGSCAFGRDACERRTSAELVLSTVLFRGVATSPGVAMTRIRNPGVAARPRRGPSGRRRDPRRDPSGDAGPQTRPPSNPSPRRAAKSSRAACPTASTCRRNASRSRSAAPAGPSTSRRRRGLLRSEILASGSPSWRRT